MADNGPQELHILRSHHTEAKFAIALPKKHEHAKLRVLYSLYSVSRYVLVQGNVCSGKPLLGGSGGLSK